MGAAGDTIADRVLGQFDFTHNGINIVTAAGVYNPQAVAVDRSVVPNRLYVADTYNRRVLGWKSVDALVNGAPADLVIGQPDFLTSIPQCANSAVGRATLCNPIALAVDPSGNLYVADSGNSRVLEYDSPFTTDTLADLVFGQNGSFTSSTPHCSPGFITDSTLCGPGAVAVDDMDNVYIADTAISRILEYDMPLATDTRADRVLGQGGDFNSGDCNHGGVSADSLCGPTFLAIDARGNLYATDYFNGRVLEYNTPPKNDTRADLVFGQGNDFSSSSRPETCTSTPAATTLCAPNGIDIDAGGNLYIADTGFARILEYNDPVRTGDTTADAVLGQPDFTSNKCSDVLDSGPCGSTGITVDGEKNLYAVEPNANRILRFSDPFATKPPNQIANLVLGQVDFNHSGPNITKANGLYEPLAVAIDSSVSPNRLYVSDNHNSRVLGWSSVPAFKNGAPPDLVIGQPDFSSTACDRGKFDSARHYIPAADTLCAPQGVAVDIRGNLYVADTRNFRVLEYDKPFSSGRIAGLAANLVFGQHGSFTSAIGNNDGVSADSLGNAMGVSTDPAGNLYVADGDNSRVLEFNSPAILRDTTADLVFGQGGTSLASPATLTELVTRMDASPLPTACAGLTRSR